MASYYEDRQRIEDEAADEAARAFEQTLQINEQHDSAGSSTNPFDPRNNQEYSGEYIVFDVLMKLYFVVLKCL